MGTQALGDRTLDVRADRPDMRDRIYNPRLVSLPSSYPRDEFIAEQLPRYEAADLILDQGSEGACTGFGLAALINYLQFREAMKWEREARPRVSPRMLYHLARIYDEWPGEDYEGSSCRGAVKGWFHHGVCSEDLWRYRNKAGEVVFVPPVEGWDTDAASRPLGAYYRVVHDAIADLQAAIVEVGAVFVSACVHSGWERDRLRPRPAKRKVQPNAVLDLVPDIPWSGTPGKGGHAFALVGYDRDGFIVQNSWGPRWGFHGFARLSYADWLAHGMDAWVAVLGAEINGKSPPIVLSGSRTVPETAPELRRGLASGITAEAVAAQASSKNPQAAAAQVATPAWNLADAAKHALVLANNGRLAPQLLIEAEDAAQAARLVCSVYPEQWITRTRSRNPKIVVYAHGGLNSLAAALARARVLGWGFDVNDVYPIFVCWQSGFLDAVKDLIEDTVRDIFGTQTDPRSIQAQGFFEEARDRALETFAVPAVRPLWQQMKQNAVAASVDQGGLVAASEHLASLQRQHGAEIHLIGHSAGAVVLGPFLDLLAGAKVKVGSLSLFAPACTVAFAMRHFAPHIGKTVPADKVAIDVLSDANERNDEVGPYKKSLLYLVSRALEDTHKTPILGLQAVWHPPLDEKDILAGLDPKRRPTTSAADARLVPDAVTAWRQAWARWKGAKLGVLAAPEVSNGLTKEPANHGCFDNWADGIADTIIRIRGNPLKAPLPPLVGF